MSRLCPFVVVAWIASGVAPAAAQSLDSVALLVNPKSGIKTLADFVAWGQRSTTPLTYSSAGDKSAGNRLATAFAQKVGIKVVHVPYRAVSQGLLDLLGGHIDFATVNIIAAAGQVRGGLLLALAVATKARVPEFPDVPTFAEAGHPEFAGLRAVHHAVALTSTRLTALEIVAPRY